MSIRRIFLILMVLAAVLVPSLGAGAQAVPVTGKWTGAVESFDGAALTVSGLHFQAASTQLDAGVTLTAGELVQVKFNVAGGALSAFKIELLEPGDDDTPGTGRVTGMIENASPDSVMIGGIAFNVIGARIDDDATLTAGSLVELRFSFNGASLIVTRVEAEDAENDGKAIGVIEAMDATTITVGGVVFDISQAQIDDEGTLVVGVMVEIEFTIGSDGTVFALDVEIKDSADDDGANEDLHASGVIEAMGEGTITVNGMMFNIVQAVLDDEGTLAIGVSVSIDYFVDENGTAIALQVEIDDSADDNGDNSDNDNDGDNGDDDGENFDDGSADFVLSGTVEAINGTLLTVAGVTVDIAGVPISDDDTIDVGDTLTIYFVAGADGSLVPVEIDEVEDIDDPFDHDDSDDHGSSDDNSGHDDDDSGSNDDNSGSNDDVDVINGCVRPAGWTNYRVRQSDTLGRIATAASSTVDDLMKANCLANASLIFVGQTLFVPVQIAPPDNSGSSDDNSGDDDDDDSGGSDDGDDDDDNGGGSDDDGSDDNGGGGGDDSGDDSGGGGGDDSGGDDSGGGGGDDGGSGGHG